MKLPQSNCSIQTNRVKDKIFYHADDLGLDQNINKKIFALIKQRKLHSISLIVNMPSFAKAIKGLSETKAMLPIFIHLNLVEGKPVSRPKDIPTLVDANGNFLGRRKLLQAIAFKQIASSDVEKEIAAQYTKVDKTGLKIYGLDAHQHFYIFSPIAESAHKFANTKKITYRAYKMMKTTSLKGKFKLQLIKLLAIWSKLIYFSSLKLPPTWQDAKCLPFYIGSWEKVKMSKVKKGSTVVFHPGSKHDQLCILR